MLPRRKTIAGAESGEWRMGMMVTARKVAEDANEVRYEFGLDRRFDRVLVIEKSTWRATTEDGRFDAPAGAAAATIRASWQAQGVFPPGVVFAG
jgi:hypothetical protein